MVIVLILVNLRIGYGSGKTQIKRPCLDAVRGANEARDQDVLNIRRMERTNEATKKCAKQGRLSLGGDGAFIYIEMLQRNPRPLCDTKKCLISERSLHSRPPLHKFRKITEL